MKAVIVEDELIAAQNLQRLIHQVDSDIEVIAVLQSVEESIDWFMLHPAPELVFMDIHLADGSSFSIFEKVEISCPIIFTTAYDEYALKAFEVNALDYLMKPIEPRRLTDVLQKLHLADEKELALQQSQNRSLLSENDQVFVKDGERCWFVKLSEVRLFESVGNYAKVFFGNNKPLILKSLNALEERLDERIFFRANRKHIVNMRMIEKIEPYFNGGLLLELHGGEKVEVSRRQAVKFKEMMSL